MSLSNDLDFIIRSMDEIMNTSFNILKDLKKKLSNMLDIKTETEMHKSARIIHQIIQMLQKTNYIEEVTPDILKLLIEKSCNQLHRINFNNDFCKMLTRAAEVHRSGHGLLDEISISKNKLRDHEISNNYEGPNNMSIQEQISFKVQFLYSYLDDILQTSFINPEIKPSIESKSQPRVKRSAKNKEQMGIQARHTALRKVTICIKLWPL